MKPLRQQPVKIWKEWVLEPSTDPYLVSVKKVIKDTKATKGTKGIKAIRGIKAIKVIVGIKGTKATKGTKVFNQRIPPLVI